MTDMQSLEQIAALSAADRTAEYQRAHAAHRREMDENRGVPRPNVFNEPRHIAVAHARPREVSASVYQTVCAIMSGIWDDNVRAGKFIASVSERHGQLAIDAAIAARRAELLAE